MSKKVKIILTVVVVIVVIGVIGNSVNNNNTTKVEVSKQEDKGPAYTVTDVTVEKDTFAIKVKGVLKNNTDKKKDYIQITFNVKDKAGNKVGKAWTNVTDLGAGETWAFNAHYVGSEKDVEIDLENPVVEGF